MFKIRDQFTEISDKKSSSGDLDQSKESLIMLSR